MNKSLISKSVALCGVLASSMAFAVAPKVQGTGVTLRGTCTVEEATAARATFDAAKSNAKFARLNITDADDASLAALAGAFPECIHFAVNKSKVTNIAALSQVKAKVIELRGCVIDDLSPLASCVNLEKLNLQGATVKDFSPLAKCPNLKEINFYETKAEPAAYLTLGALKQCKIFIGGRSNIESIEWVKETPQIEELQIFEEKVADFSPITTAKNLKVFRGWNMTGKKMGRRGEIPALGDLSFLAGCSKLEKLELPGSQFSNLAALAGLRNLNRVSFGGAKSDVDLTFLKDASKLTILNVSGCLGKVTGFDALAGHTGLQFCDFSNLPAVDISFLKTCPKLKSIELWGTKRVPVKVTGFEAISAATQLERLDIRLTEGCSLAAIKPTAKFSYVMVTKDMFPEAEVKAFEATMKAANPRAKVIFR